MFTCDELSTGRRDLPENNTANIPQVHTLCFFNSEYEYDKNFSLASRISRVDRTSLFLLSSTQSFSPVLDLLYIFATFKMRCRALSSTRMPKWFGITLWINLSMRLSYSTAFPLPLDFFNPRSALSQSVACDKREKEWVRESERATSKLRSI